MTHIQKSVNIQRQVNFHKWTHRLNNKYLHAYPHPSPQSLRNHFTGSSCFWFSNEVNTAWTRLPGQRIKVWKPLHTERLGPWSKRPRSVLIIVPLYLKPWSVRQKPVKLRNGALSLSKLLQFPQEEFGGWGARGRLHCDQVAPPWCSIWAERSSLEDALMCF